MMFSVYVSYFCTDLGYVLLFIYSFIMTAVFIVFAVFIISFSVL